MINPKKKGNSFELKCIKIFKELTKEDIHSSRYTNKRLDDEGVDFETKDYYVQCKAVENNINTHKIIEKMKDGKTKVLLHKRNRQGVIVSLKLVDFIELLNKLQQ